MAQWNQNYLDPTLNNFRQQAQGSVGAELLPDLTAELMADACFVNENKLQLSAEVCNRGAKPVGAGLETAFFSGDPMDQMVLCVATTVDVLAPEQCVKVSCEIDGPLMGALSVVANNDGTGKQTTLECIETNNGDVVDPVVCN